jgi:hypothetical protein
VPSVDTMTTRTLAAPRHDTSAVLAHAAWLGLVLGVVDLVLIRLLPYPLADLANSSAMWAVGAFLLGRTVPGRPELAAAAGAVFLVVGVESYYLVAAVVDLARPGAFLSVNAVAWCVLGVLAGGLFGAAGAWSRDADRWRSASAVALVPGVLLAEAWLRRGLPDTAVLTAAVAVALLVGLSRGPGALLRAGALVVPLAPACVVGFRAAGF